MIPIFPLSSFKVCSLLNIDTCCRWNPMRFMIGKISQEVRIIIEITRPNYVNLAHTLPHIAIDNIRMIECVPEPPVYNGECVPGQLKCKIMKVTFTNIAYG